MDVIDFAEMQSYYICLGSIPDIQRHFCFHSDLYLLGFKEDVFMLLELHTAVSSHVFQCIRLSYIHWICFLF